MPFSTIIELKNFLYTISIATESFFLSIRGSFSSTVTATSSALKEMVCTGLVGVLPGDADTAYPGPPVRDSLCGWWPTPDPGRDKCVCEGVSSENQIHSKSHSVANIQL